MVADLDGETLFIDDDGDACLAPSGRDMNLVALPGRDDDGGPLRPDAWAAMVSRFNAFPIIAIELADALDREAAKDAEIARLWEASAEAAEAEVERLRTAQGAAGVLEPVLRGLLKGEHSSLTIGFNDDHACNYVTAQQFDTEWGGYSGEDCRINWLSDADRDAALAGNLVWTLQWYPNTPVGFRCVGASSLPGVLLALAEEQQ
jgi:hypothetical protein